MERARVGRRLGAHRLCGNVESGRADVQRDTADHGLYGGRPHQWDGVHLYGDGDQCGRDGRGIHGLFFGDTDHGAQCTDRCLGQSRRWAGVRVVDRTLIERRIFSHQLCGNVEPGRADVQRDAPDHGLRGAWSHQWDGVHLHCDCGQCGRHRLCITGFVLRHSSRGAGCSDRGGWDCGQRSGLRVVERAIFGWRLSFNQLCRNVEPGWADVQCDAPGYGLHGDRPHQWDRLHLHCDCGQCGRDGCGIDGLFFGDTAHGARRTHWREWDCGQRSGVGVVDRAVVERWFGLDQLRRHVEPGRADVQRDAADDGLRGDGPH